MHTGNIDRTLSEIIRARRSVRDFLPDPIPQAILDEVLADANCAPSWSNTQPYRIAIASGTLRDNLKAALTSRYDKGMAAQRGGWLGKLKLLVTRDGLPDGDYRVDLEYPKELQAKRRATGYGLYQLLDIDRKDHAAREAQMRRNFEFFGAPTAIFVFVHNGLREFAVLDAGFFVQTLLLSAQAHGLGTCAQGALATWGGPVREAFVVPNAYKLICGVSIGFASPHPVNTYNPGRGRVDELLITART
jgi:nitroreductase